MAFHGQRQRAAGTPGRLVLVILAGVLLAGSSLATPVEETDSELETKDRRQSLDLREGDGSLGSLLLGGSSSRAPNFLSMLGLPKWLTTLVSPAAAAGGSVSPDGGGEAAPSGDADISSLSQAPLSPEFGGWWQRAQNFIDRMGNAKTVDDRLRTVLGALEGLDELLRSTVPRMDQFNCLERVMCEVAAPFEDDASDAGNFLEDGVQTLQQISNSPILQQLPQQLLGGQPGQRPPFRQQQFQQQPQQFIRPHQQQFLQHQQHQKRFIQQQVAQQQQQVQPVVPPLPYYIPTPEDGPQQFREQSEYLTPRGSQSDENVNYQENAVRREEHHRGPQQHYQEAQASSQQQVYHEQHQPQQYHRQQHAYQPQGHPQQSSYHQPQYQQQQYHHQNAAPNRPRRRRQPPAWRRALNSFLGRGQSAGGNRRGRREAVEESNAKIASGERNVRGSSRQSKIASEFKTGSSRQSKISSEFKTGSNRQSKIAAEFKNEESKAKPKKEGPASVKTLTRDDLAVIRARIEAINAKVLEDAKSPSSSGATSGRAGSSRQARFLGTFINGWTAKSLLGVLDNLMDGYSFHPYTHAAYMGYTSRAGTCASMYPKCPDSASDMLDFVNNFHRYFPNGMPFKDSLPWPLNLLVP